MADSAGNKGQSGLLASAAAALAANLRWAFPQLLDLVEDVHVHSRAQFFARDLPAAGQQSQVVRGHAQMLSRVVSPDPGHAVLIDEY